MVPFVPRRVELNDVHANGARGFTTNVIKTTKYNLFNFVPKQLYEQFRRACNFYFLLICILQVRRSWLESCSCAHTNGRACV